MSAPRSSEQKLMASTMISDISSTDYGAYMRSSMSTTADLLLSIERDIQESRELIQTKNTDERVLTRLVSSLEEDNNILQVNPQVYLHVKCFLC